MPKKPNTIDEAFFAERSSVNEETKCIEWTKYVSKLGYGTVKHKGKQYPAHRFAWEYKNGPIPEGLFVCHRCDNRKCINLEHLFLGTALDNMRDMIAKGRKVVGVGQKRTDAKLTNEQICAIRTDPRTQKDIAKSYGISQSNVSLIKQRKAWSHVAVKTLKYKRMTVKELAALFDVPYLPLKDRIYHGAMSIGDALAAPYRAKNAVGRTVVL